jgi:2-polyprenyl-3-methyl-5-hydroxy-6-metoxy-1,4-benzoquinol methylase
MSVALACPELGRGAVAPAPFLEDVVCYGCGGGAARPFIKAQDDLTGKPGIFQFVRCDGCGLTYQNPRVSLDYIKEYYDEEYIAHRKTNWGLLNKAFDRAMNQLDAAKDGLVSRYVSLDRASEVLDVGCGVGTFLRRLHDRYGAGATGIDFKDLSAYPALRGTEFHCGLFYDTPLTDRRFDLVTMWHYLEHDYDPLRSLRTAHRVLKPGGTMVIEVPRLDSTTFRLFRHRWPGLQAPQHTVLYDREHLLKFVERAGFEYVDYLPYGAFPAYFYLFTGAAFLMLKGRGLNLKRAIAPYFVGKVLTSPIFAFEKHLNLAMQTVVCRRSR